MEGLNIREFDPKRVADQSFRHGPIAIIGPAGCGKTSLILELLSHFQDVPFVSVMSPTQQYTQTYKGIVPPKLITDFDKKMTNESISRQEYVINHKDVDPRGIYVFDDCLHRMKKIRDDDDMDMMCLNSRGLKMLPIFSCQYPIVLSPAQRGNLGYIFLFYDPNQSNRDKLFLHYAGVFPTKKCFFDAYDAATRDHGYLVIDNTNQQTRSIEDRVFWGKTKPISALSKFRLCDPKYWNESVSENEAGSDGDNDDLKNGNGDEEQESFFDYLYQQMGSLFCFGNQK